MADIPPFLTSMAQDFLECLNKEIAHDDVMTIIETLSCSTAIQEETLRWRHNEQDSVSNTSLTIVYSTIYSGADQSKHQSSASLAFVWGIHRGPVNSPHKWPVTRKMFPFDDVIMNRRYPKKGCFFSSRIREKRCFSDLGMGMDIRFGREWGPGLLPVDFPRIGQAMRFP